MPRFRRQDQSRERTPEEREAARVERESRRTGGRGAAPRTPAAIARAETAQATPAEEPLDDALTADWPDEEEVAARAELRRLQQEPVDAAPPAAPEDQGDRVVDPPAERHELPAEPPADPGSMPTEVHDVTAEPPGETAAGPPPEEHAVVADPPAPSGAFSLSERLADDEPVAPTTEVHDAAPVAPPEPRPGEPAVVFDALGEPDDQPGAGEPTAAFDAVIDPVGSAAPPQPTVAFDALAAAERDEPGAPTEAYDVVAERDAAGADLADGPAPPAPHQGAPLTPAERRARARFGDEDERPVPLRRPGARRTLPPTPPAPGAGGGGRGPRRPRRAGGGGGGGAGAGGPGGSSGRRGRRPGLVLAAVLGLALLAVGAYLAVATFQPFSGEGEGRVRVEVPRNATAGEIAELLERRGVISSAFFFNLRARIDGAREGLRAGTYTLRRDMPHADAIAALQAGPPPPRTINVTIPEGRSRREIAPLVEQAGLDGSYLRATRGPTDGFSLRRYGAPTGRGLEGFLFPATYELRPNADARALVARQLAAFQDTFGEVDLAAARRRDLDAYDVLIIASMIEREATIARERRLMSAVIHNRLRQGIPLGIDATTRYETANWTRPIRQSELEADTPYNTRLNTGLPPTPIGNPGLASMRAAADPADSDVLFYVARICGGGAHDFSATSEEFEADVARYNAERDRRGGRAPTDC